MWQKILGIFLKKNVQIVSQGLIFEHKALGLSSSGIYENILAPKRLSKGWDCGQL